MAVLGYGGIVRLRRESPAQVRVYTSDHHVQTNSLALMDQAFWSGDEVILSAQNGLPIAIYEDVPACPDGYAIYADGPWPLNPRTLHLLTDSSNFYAASDSRIFYTTADDVGQLTEATYFIYRDQMDRISFYASRSGGLNGEPSQRIQLYAVDFGEITITPVSQSWLTQADLRNWSLNLNAAEVDTTSVGDKFGDAVKSVVNGGGSFDFLVDRKELENGGDSTGLMQLLLLTQKGCRSEAEFWMIGDKQEYGKSILPGDLYYSTEILITSSAINVRPDDVIAGSANFVTVGEIALRMGTN